MHRLGKNRTRTIGLIMLMLMLLLPVPKLAAASAQADSVSLGGIPVAGFSSDSGFGFGGLLQYISYEDEFDHFRRKLRAQSTLFLRGKLFTDVFYEAWMRSGNRISVRIRGQLEPDALYFGRGIETDFNARSFRNEAYHYRREMLTAEALYGFALASGSSARHELEIGLTGGAIRNRPKADSRLGLEQPFGVRGGIRNALFAGLSRDTRDHLVRTSEGSRLSGRLSVFPALTGNRNSLLKAETAASAYIPLATLSGEPLVLAGRMQYRQVMGKASFYEQVTLGDELTLRGFPLERFRDNGSLLLTAELRGWVFRLPWYNAQFGGHVFTDAGTVFLQPGEALTPAQWRLTGGLGGVMSVFSRDFILRGDIGFSGETWRIYAGLGYTF